MRCLPLYILAGGQSRRFGSDKARAVLNGTPLIQRIAHQLAPIAEQITVVADTPDKYQDLGLCTIADTLPDRGPLGGLARALLHMREQTQTDWLLLVPCDWLNPEVELIEPLFAHACESNQAVVYKQDQWQPLPGLYHRTIAPTVEQHLAHGQRAVWRLLADLPQVATVRDEAAAQIRQANTPTELAQFDD